jgi:hypothetical protein
VARNGRVKMDKSIKYSSTIKTIPYLYLETKKVARFKHQGFGDDDIYKTAIEENLFQVNTDARKKEIASTVIRRLKALDNFLLDKLVNGSVDTSKQIALYALMKTDRLFSEFMSEVYREKYILKDMVITDKDFNIFFYRKYEQDATVATWKEYTFYKLKQVYKRILFESGFIKKQKKDIEIVRPVMEQEVIDVIKKRGDKAYVEAMIGEI